MHQLKLFLIGVGALCVLAFVYAEFRLALLTFAGLVLVLVVTGFCVPIRRFLPLFLPALPDWKGEEVAAGIRPQPYPQVFVFSSDVRCLYILIIAPLYSMGLITWLLKHPDLTLNGFLNEDRGLSGPFLARGIGKLTASAVLIAWRWFSERLLLCRSAARLGILHMKTGEGAVSYEYFDTHGDRCGGMARIWGEITGPIMPVFVHEGRGDWSRPGFGFVFHRFAIRDSRHLAV